MNTTDSTKDRSSTSSGGDRATNLQHLQHRANSQHSLKSHRDEQTPAEPLSTTPDRKVTLRSERSLRRTIASGQTSSVHDLEHGANTRKLTILECFKTVILATKINVLLVFIPIGIIAHALHWPDVAVFILNFIAIVPLAKRKFSNNPLIGLLVLRRRVFRGH